MNYQPTQKITLFAQGGVEFRQYDHGGDKTNPIFSGGVGYAPFDSTVLQVNAFQDVRSSNADSEQTVVSTGVGFSATQRLLQRFYLNFTFNYSHQDNQAVSGSDQTGGTTPPPSSGISTASGNSQDNLVYRPSFSFQPTAWSSVALYYQYLDNESSTAGGSYHDNQMGVSVTARF